MKKISQEFYILLLLKVIKELEYKTSKSIILLYHYIKIIYDTIGIFNYKFKQSTNPNLNMIRHNWIKTIFYDEKFYHNLMILVNTQVLKGINKYLNSSNINNYVLNDFEKKINTSQNYNYFNKIHAKSISEINNIINSYCDDYFFKLFNDYLSNEEIVIDDIFNNLSKTNDFILDQNDLNFFEKYLTEEYCRISKSNELIEILNLSNNVEDEKIKLSEFWIEMINKFGIIGLWNFILCCCFLNGKNIDKTDEINFDDNVLKKIETFYKLNLYLFNGVITSNYFKNMFKNISPYNLLQNDIFNLNSSNQNVIWFVKNRINFNYSNLYDYPSEINLLSTISLNVIMNVDLKITDLNLKICFQYFDLYDEKNIFPQINLNDKKIDHKDFDLFQHSVLNYVDLESLFENLTQSYLNCLQSYLTSHHMGREIGINIYTLLNKKLKF